MLCVIIAAEKMAKISLLLDGSSGRSGPYLQMLLNIDRISKG